MFAALSLINEVPFAPSPPGRFTEYFWKLHLSVFTALLLIHVAVFFVVSIPVVIPYFWYTLLGFFFHSDHWALAAFRAPSCILGRGAGSLLDCWAFILCFGVALTTIIDARYFSLSLGPVLTKF